MYPSNKEIAQKLLQLNNELMEINSTSQLPFVPIPNKESEIISVIIQINWNNRLGRIIKRYFADSRSPSQIDEILKSSKDLQYLNALDTEFWDLVEADVRDNFEDIVNELTTLIKEVKRKDDFMAIFPLPILFQTNIYRDLYQLEKVIS